VKQYDILKGKNASVGTVYYLMRYLTCNHQPTAPQDNIHFSLNVHFPYSTVYGTGFLLII